MEKQREKIRRLVQDLAARYGSDDEDVRRLQAELKALEAVVQVPKLERRKANPDKRSFQPVSRLFFDATRPGDLH